MAIRANIENKEKICFFPLDIDYETLKSGEAQIRIFGVTRDKKRIAVLDKKALPYFLIMPKKGTNIDYFLKKLKTLEVRSEAKLIKIKNVIIESRNYLGEKVSIIKVFVSHPSHIKLIRKVVQDFKEVEDTKEFDINFYKRYLLDREVVPCVFCCVEGKIVNRQDLDVDIVVEASKIKQYSQDLVSDLKILAFDIETLFKGAASNAKHDAIIMCSFYGRGLKKVITWKKYKDAPYYMKFVDGELELIEEFKKIIKEYKPDILVSYNGDQFDLPYIRERAEKYKIKLDLGLDFSEIDLRRKGIASAAKIKGVVHLDMYVFIHNILRENLDTERYDLDSVSAEILGLDARKRYFDFRKLNEIWSIGLKEDLENLSAYNLRDSELTYKICEKILPTELQLVKLISLPLFDINRLTYGQLVEWFLMNNASKTGKISPNRPWLEIIRKRRKHTFEGGFVKEPKPGFYKNIFVFDFRSLYPSIIASHNIGLESFNCECCQYKGGYNLEDNKIWFCSKKEGFIPGLVKSIIERRRRVKSILNKTSKSDPSYAVLNSRQYSLKILANSFYGYLGFPASRWYSLDCARAVTWFGRKYIQEVIKEAEKFGFNVLYGDTDSIFLLLGNKKKKNIPEFLKIINSILPSPMELEYQGFYSSGIFIGKKGDRIGAKKRYALLAEDGDIILRGVEAIRGDWSKIAKDTQRQIIEMVLKDGEAKRAIKYLQMVINKIDKRDVSLDDLSIKTKLTKNLSEYKSRGPHVAAASIAKDKGYDVFAGFVVDYIVGEGDGKIGDKVILTEDAGIEDYDKEYYINNQIIRSVYKILEIFGYTEEKLKEGQTTLSSW